MTFASITDVSESNSFSVRRCIESHAAASCFRSIIPNFPACFASAAENSSARYAPNGSDRFVGSAKVQNNNLQVFGGQLFRQPIRYLL
jgi:hypothetical protein